MTADEQEPAFAGPPEVIDLDAPVVLSRIREEDAEQYAAAVRASLEQLRPWLPWADEGAADVERQRVRCREAQAAWGRGTEYLYTIRDVVTSALVGTIGLHRRVGESALEIGYWLHADRVGHGSMTAAVVGVTEAALALPDVSRVEIHVEEANIRSAAVPRRAGFVLAEVRDVTPEAPAETGRRQIWISPGPAPS